MLAKVADVNKAKLQEKLRGSIAKMVVPSAIKLLELDGVDQLKLDNTPAGKFEIAGDMAKHCPQTWAVIVTNYTFLYDFASWPFSPLPQLIHVIDGCISLMIIDYESFNKVEQQPYGSIALAIQGKADILGFLQKHKIVYKFACVKSGQSLNVPFGQIILSTSLPMSDAEIIVAGSADTKKVKKETQQGAADEKAVATGLVVPLYVTPGNTHGKEARDKVKTYFSESFESYGANKMFKNNKEDFLNWLNKWSP